MADTPDIIVAGGVLAGLAAAIAPGARGMISTVRSKPKCRVDRAEMILWLRPPEQTANAIETFLPTVLVGALNEELESVTACYRLKVFWKCFGKNCRSYRMGLP